MNYHKMVLFALILSLSFIIGCGGGGGGTTPVIATPTSQPPTIQPTSSPTMTPTPISQNISPAIASTVNVGEAKVNFQINSVREEVTFSGNTAGNITPNLPIGMGTASNVYSFTLSRPEAYDPNNPAYITLPISGSTEGAAIYRSSDGGTTWTNIGGTVNGSTISSNTPGFSYFVAGHSVTAPTITPSANPTQTGNLSKIFFLHHSVGNDLTERGNLRTAIGNYNSSHGTNYGLWDHSYNDPGLRDNNGNFIGTYNIPNDNTNPDGLNYLFTSSNSDALNARNQIMNNYQVIVFKSCYIALDNLDSTLLNQYKTYYIEMRNFFDLHPEKLFIIVTVPPKTPAETNSTESNTGRQFANWLKSSEYLTGHNNIVCFDFFDQLADSNNMLKSAYQSSDPHDSHPNEYADQVIGPIFIQFIIDSANNYHP